MAEISKSYDTKIDSKKRITIRNAKYSYYNVKEYDNGIVVLEPRELISPFKVSENTLYMMDESVKNIKNKKVSKKVNLDDFKD